MATRWSESDAVTLLTGGSGSSKWVNVDGAWKVNIAVTADTTQQLTTGTVSLLMTDGRTVTITPTALPGGTDGTTVEINCAGVITTVDLSAVGNHRSITIRPIIGGATGPFGITGPLSGVRAVRLNLAKGAGATTIYTIQYTVYD